VKDWVTLIYFQLKAFQSVLAEKQI